MKIKDESIDLIKIEQMGGGLAFRYNDDLYLRIEESVNVDYEVDYNAIRLEDGVLVYFDLCQLVELVDCELVVTK